MLLAILLLVCAITGGTLLTFLFDRSTPRAARLCMGACIGLALMAILGFLLALVFGLGATTIILTALLLLLPWLLLLSGDDRVVILNALRPSAPSYGRLRRGRRLSGVLSRHRHSSGDGVQPRRL